MHAPRPRRRRGVGLVELLVALAISAALLTATAVAIDASFRGYAINQQQADLTQRARITMHRLTTYLRATKEHQPYASSAAATFASGVIATDSGVRMFTNAGQEVAFRLDTATGRLLLSEGGTDRVLLRGVGTFTVSFEPMRSEQSIKTGGPHDLLKRATILLTVQPAGNSADANETYAGHAVTLSSSIMPRRNVW